ncbi:MAG TPA: pseudouridine synthase [Pseudomonadales bacterium]|nr:pseudouridine synthase [Pseudomonadales bacterium]
MARLILFNKPFNVMSQFTDDSGRDTLADFIPIKGVYPAGRLDYDSEGLLLLTDDGRLQHQIAHPKAKLGKTYWVQVEGDIDETALDKLRHGVVLNDGNTLPAKAVRLDDVNIWDRHPPIRHRANIPTTWIALTIKEGRNRQVRRMTAAVGYPTLRLVRVQIGEWQVKGLAPGEYCEIMLTMPVAPRTIPNRQPPKPHSRGRKPKR